MSVLHVPVLISRMKHMGKKDQGSDAGIHVVFHISHSIHRDIIHGMYNQQDGDSG
jgi:hypothetical protein